MSARMTDEAATNARGALGRLTRAAFGKSKGLPSERDMNDSSALSAALNEMERARASETHQAAVIDALVKALEFAVKAFADNGSDDGHWFGIKAREALELARKVP